MGWASRKRLVKVWKGVVVAVFVVVKHFLIFIYKNESILLVLKLLVNYN